MNYVQVLNVPSHLVQSQGPKIFLAGPTPRDRQTPSWRPDFIKVLEQKEFVCTVFVPETADGWWHNNYDAQCEWEHEYLNEADWIAFWVPRNLETMPAFTTNIEFGYWMAENPDKVIYGRPDGAPKTKYLDWLYQNKLGETPTNSMKSLADAIIAAEG